jgi:hypothetical protein
MAKHNPSEKFKKIEEEIIDASREGDLYRGRSLGIGTAFGGVVEINIRLNNGHCAWLPLQPVEATEIIHQLAAAIGCHINLQPREDFASWRKWNERIENNSSHAPMAVPFKQDCSLPKPEDQPGLKIDKDRSHSDDTVMAIKKHANK